MPFDGSLATPANRYRVSAGAGASVTADCSSASEIIHKLPHGAIVVCAEVRSDGADADRVRISSPAGWMSGEDLEPAGPAPSLRLDYETFCQRERQVGPGDHYGLEFPFTLDLLREFGADFLTAAFRASGAIAEDNRVTEIVELRHLGIMGASENAFLTVAYANPGPDLHTELFVKFPPESVGHKFGLSVSSQGEVAMLRLSKTAALPVTVAKYYFGDYCSATTNYILITERIKFGVAPIEPAYIKGRDQDVPDVEEHYRVLAKALARLVAAHKTGAMGYLEEAFPFARAARDFAPLVNPEAAIDRLIDFISRIAPQLFVAETTKAEFLARWREDLLFGLAHKDAVIAYLHANVDYTGLCHSNLNIDNAWYWRDDAGELQVGLLDWGGVGQMSIAQALSGMVMMPDPDIYSSTVRDVTRTFLDEYEKRSGMKLDYDELIFQHKASLYSTALWIIVSMIVDMLPKFTEEEYGSMKDRFDIRLQKTRLATGIIWIDNMLREWLEETTPGDACRRIVALAG